MTDSRSETVNKADSPARNSMDEKQPTPEMNEISETAPNDSIQPTEKSTDSPKQEKDLNIQIESIRSSTCISSFLVYLTAVASDTPTSSPPVSPRERPPGPAASMLSDREQFSEEYLINQAEQIHKWNKYFNIYGNPDATLIKDARIKRLIVAGIPDKFRGSIGMEDYVILQGSFGTFALELFIKLL